MIHVKTAFVIGHPIKHSRSPLIHGSWIARYGFEASYAPFDVAPEELGRFVERIRLGEFVGGNVTIPHKEAVFALCDEVDPLARTIGAVNTLVRTVDDTDLRLQHRLHGLSGQSRPERAGLGSWGWSAPSCSAPVARRGPSSWRCASGAEGDRAAQPHAAKRPRRWRARSAGRSCRVRSPTTQKYAGEAGLLVNTTSIGMHDTRFDNLDLTLLPRTALVTDIVYVPLVTPLLADARALGLRTVDGLGMLLHQAVPGFEAWFGVRPEVTPELRARVEATL